VTPSRHQVVPEDRKGGSDEIFGSTEPRFVAIGQIVRPHGVHGEVAVEVWTDFPERFTPTSTVYLGDAVTAQPRRVSSVRWHKERVLLAFHGCTDRTCADTLRGLLVQIPVEDAMPLPEGEYYPYQLVGLSATTVDGEDLGRIVDVLFTKANEIYVVKGPRGEIWLPAVADVVERVDLAARRVVVRLLPGLI
jgi:16S rRNA processing protein RimM